MEENAVRAMNEGTHRAGSYSIQFRCRYNSIPFACMFSVEHTQFSKYRKRSSQLSCLDEGLQSHPSERNVRYICDTCMHSHNRITAQPILEFTVNPQICAAIERLHTFWNMTHCTQPAIKERLNLPRSSSILS